MYILLRPDEADIFPFKSLQIHIFGFLQMKFGKSVFGISNTNSKEKYMQAIGLRLSLSYEKGIFGLF